MEFSHLNSEGHSHMVDVSDKTPTVRYARAAGKVVMTPSTLEKVIIRGIAKGDVLAVAQVAGIMAAKCTSDIIPMCHPLALSGVDISFSYEPNGIAVIAEVKCKSETGVEMEALTAVSAAALTIYDMCKSVQKDMTITDIRLLEKTGGKSGDYRREK